MQFNELNLKESSLKALAAIGFETPTEIQEKSIPILIEKDTDFIGQAQTGTGKTLAFALPMLEKIDSSQKTIQSIIIAPTRELAKQICEEVGKITKFDKINCTPVYGGTSVGDQIREIKKTRPQVVAGTPGRILDLIDRRVLNLKDCKLAILDEADEMLDMGFIDDIRTILASLGEEKKIWMFSATMPKPILRLINDFFQNPHEVLVKKKTLSSDNIEQSYYLVHRSNRNEALCRLLDSWEEFYAIVFCKTRVETKELVTELNARGYTADCLHGDMDQKSRDMTMKAFKEKKIKLLICTDVAARGIDVDNLSHVINYALPQDRESYVHRIGRTGRAGNKGEAIAIIDNSEVRRIADIERITKAKIERKTLPTIEELRSIIIDRVSKRLELLTEEKEEKTSKLFDGFKERFEKLDKAQLLRATFELMADESLKRYKNARDIDLKARTQTAPGVDRYYMGAGSARGLEVRDIVRIVCSSTNVPGKDVGKIVLRDHFTFFEVPQKHRDIIHASFPFQVNGEEIRVELSKEQASAGRSGGRRSGGGGRGFGGRRRGNSYGGGGDRNGNRRGGNSASGPDGNRRRSGDRRRFSGASKNTENRGYTVTS